MKKILIRASITFVVIVVVVLVIGFALPDKAHVERSTRIMAPPVTVFGLVNGFRQFERWSPWAGKDPDMKVTRSGPEYGVGAKYEWAGNSAVGTGSQEILTSTANSEVTLDLRFGDSPLPSVATFRISPETDGNSVLTWSLDIGLGGNPVNRYFGLFIDGIVGADYEIGLARLKALAENLPHTDFSGLNIELTDGAGTTYAYLSGTTTTNPGDIAKALADAYAKVAAALKTAKVTPGNGPLAINRRYDPDLKVYEFDAGLLVANADTPLPNGAVRYGQTPTGLVLKVTHTGAYSDLSAVYQQMAAFEAVYGFADNGNTWEQYLSDPNSTPEAERVTTINFPVK